MDNIESKLGIDYSYDSHVHFFGTGIPAIEWDLKTQNQVPSHLLNKSLIRGFGWNDETYFINEVKKHHAHHFFLSKIDGHTAFASKNLIKSLNIDSSDFIKVEDVGFILKEHERDFIERLLPKRSFNDLKKMALFSQNLFISKGITKVRHLTCTAQQWETLIQLEHNGELNLEIECFFSEFMEQTFEESIEAFSETKSTKNLKPKGLKVFYDGSFGSKTAYSAIFPTVEPRINFDQLKNRMAVAIELECDIAVHCIGEKAVLDSLLCFKEALNSNCELKTHTLSKTKLHLEHCPALSNKCISLIEELCPILHFQPSHYKGDKIHLDKLKDLGLKIYPFSLLKKKNIEFHFGSDSPVSTPYGLDDYKDLSTISFN